MAFYRTSCLFWLTFEPQGFPVENYNFFFLCLFINNNENIWQGGFLVFKNTCLFLYIGLAFQICKLRTFISWDPIWRDLSDRLLISIDTVQILYMRERLFPSHNPNSNSSSSSCKKGRRLKSVFSFLLLDASYRWLLLTLSLSKTHCSPSNS